MVKVSYKYGAQESVRWLLLGFAVWLSLALLSYTSSDSAWSVVTSSVDEVDNWCGVCGAWCADWLFGFVGYAVYPPLLIFLSINFTSRAGRSHFSLQLKILAMLLMLLSMSALLGSIDELCYRCALPMGIGGIVGRCVWQSLSAWLGVLGGRCVLGWIALSEIAILCNVLWRDLLLASGRLLWMAVYRVADKVGRCFGSSSLSILQQRTLKLINQVSVQVSNFFLVKLGGTVRRVAVLAANRWSSYVKRDEKNLAVDGGALSEVASWQNGTSQRDIAEPTEDLEPDKLSSLCWSELDEEELVLKTKEEELLRLDQLDQLLSEELSRNQDDGCEGNQLTGGDPKETEMVKNVGVLPTQVEADSVLINLVEDADEKLVDIAPQNSYDPASSLDIDAVTVSGALDSVGDLQRGVEKQSLSELESADRVSASSGPELMDHDSGVVSNQSWIFPSVELLERSADGAGIRYSSDELRQLSCAVEEKLRDFGIKAKVVNALPGPVITRFELELSPGTKVSKITSLAKDLARSMSVISVRVVEVIPGKSVVGLELPNRNREIVRLRELLVSEQFSSNQYRLALALGKGISGEPVVVDLAKMPHLLVAGTTGSGKSVCINALLLSLLYRYTPLQMRIILIDPKMLELSVYSGIPHLLAPVVVDMKEVSGVFRWCVAEMEHRYRLMAALGVRNLAGYNQHIQTAAARGEVVTNPLWEGEGSLEVKELQTLPYLVVIADEYADMMMVAGKKIEELIVRLAQKARAAGIHLILATQRPSVDVVTGLIKANIPTRIAFQVSSRIDSRTILDQAGAEQLLGAGDMLYLPIGSGVPIRVHGAFVDDDEVHRVVNQLRKNAQVDYMPLWGGSDNEVDGGAAEVGANEVDELYDQAVSWVIANQKVSVSSLQRKFRIGYNRAARLVDSMEVAGLVGPMESGGNRRVLVSPPES